MVSKRIDDLPALLLDVLAAKTELILDRRFTLIVRRIARIDGDMGNSASLLRSFRRRLTVVVRSF